MNHLQSRAIGREPSSSPAGSSAPRRGSVLIEFAFIALAFTLLMAGTIELGRMIYTAQVVQNAVRAGARELAMRPLPATATWREIFYPTTAAEAQLGADVREYVYDSGLLVKDVTNMDAAQLRAEVDAWPIVNRMLYPVMIHDTVGHLELLRYPGALLMNPNYQVAPLFQDSKYTVAIPRVDSTSSDAGGAQTISWVPVVEEIVANNDPSQGPFSLTGSVVNGMRGVVAMRINYPYQASTLSDFHPTATAPNSVVLADDSGQPPPPSPLANLPTELNQYSGKYGLGKLYVLGQEVRPYRQLISAQAMFRREVLAPRLH